MLKMVVVLGMQQLDYPQFNKEVPPYGSEAVREEFRIPGIYIAHR